LARKRLNMIQFSRAFVPIMVMLFHLSLSMHEYYDFNLLGLYQLPMSGGVSYFFALSGFMMYYVYQNNFGQPKQLKNYFINRFIRIYPLYWILTLVLLPFLLLFPWYGAGHETKLGTIISSFLLSPNPSDDPPILIPAWSLKFTILYYLMFSLLFLPKLSLGKAILAIWGGMCAAAFLGFIPVTNFIIEFIFNEINLTLLGGMCAAYLVTHVRINWFFSLLFTITGFLGFPLMWLNSLNPIYEFNFDLGTGFVSILLIIGIASIDLKKELRISRYLNYLGNAAFSIYLSHNMSLDFFNEVFSRYYVYQAAGGWVLSIILFIIMVSIGCLIHSRLEKPLINLLKKYLLGERIRIKGIKTVVVKY
jgi:exopolysaccharide production protein ExoZ